MWSSAESDPFRALHFAQIVARFSIALDPPFAWASTWSTLAPQFVEQRGGVPTPIRLEVSQPFDAPSLSQQAFEILEGRWEHDGPQTPFAEPAVSPEDLHLNGFRNRWSRDRQVGSLDLDYVGLFGASLDNTRRRPRLPLVTSLRLSAGRCVMMALVTSIFRSTSCSVPSVCRNSSSFS